MSKCLVAATLAAIFSAGQSPAAVAQESSMHHQLPMQAAAAEFAAKIATVTALDHSEIKVLATNAVIRVFR
jgi:hypothetical protein